MPNGKREQPTYEDRLTPRVPSRILPREPPLPPPPGRRWHHHLVDGPGHADGPAAFPPGLLVLLLGCHPDGDAAFVGGEGPRDGAKPRQAGAVLGQQLHPLARVRHKRRSFAAEDHPHQPYLGYPITPFYPPPAHLRPRGIEG